MLIRCKGAIIKITVLINGIFIYTIGFNAKSTINDGSHNIYIGSSENYSDGFKNGIRALGHNDNLQQATNGKSCIPNAQSRFVMGYRNLALAQADMIAILR